jgi:hypothetical protein
MMTIVTHVHLREGSGRGWDAALGLTIRHRRPGMTGQQSLCPEVLELDRFASALRDVDDLRPVLRDVRALSVHLEPRAGGSGSCRAKELRWGRDGPPRSLKSYWRLLRLTLARREIPHPAGLHAVGLVRVLAEIAGHTARRAGRGRRGRTARRPSSGPRRRRRAAARARATGRSRGTAGAGSRWTARTRSGRAAARLRGGEGRHQGNERDEKRQHQLLHFSSSHFRSYHQVRFLRLLVTISKIGALVSPWCSRPESHGVRLQAKGRGVPIGRSSRSAPTAATARGPAWPRVWGVVA